jgi:hypothetical protein
MAVSAGNAAQTTQHRPLFVVKRLSKKITTGHLEFQWEELDGNSKRQIQSKLEFQTVK